jgi:hypothetical protein
MRGPRAFGRASEIELEYFFGQLIEHEPLLFPSPLPLSHVSSLNLYGCKDYVG